MKDVRKSGTERGQKEGRKEVNKDRRKEMKRQGETTEKKRTNRI